MKIETKFAVGQEVVVIKDLKKSRPFKIKKIQIDVDNCIEIKYLGELLDTNSEHAYYPEELLFESTEIGKKELTRRVQAI